MRATAHRGCGTRVAGGIYAVVEPSKYGRPLREFLLDPPIPLPKPEEYGISPVGVSLGSLGKTEVIFDWVGAKHYPNVADFVGETGRFGLSRRLPKTLDFSRVRAGMPIALIHSRAVIEPTHRERYWREFVAHPPFDGTAPSWDLSRIGGFPCRRHEYAANNEGSDHYEQLYDLKPEFPMCPALFWEDVEGGEPILDPDVPYRSVIREMPSFGYMARRPPDNMPSDRHIPGIFAIFYLTGIDVIRDRDSRSHETAASAAARSGLPISLEDE